jgi:hypothetical protein
MSNLLDVSLLTTADLKAGRQVALVRLLRSVEDAVAALPKARITLYLLLQNCSAQEFAEFAEGLPIFVVAWASDRLIPVSRARNMLLRRAALNGGLPSGGLVAFPDDDCWYPTGLLEHVVGLFQENRRLDFWFCRYGGAPKPMDRAPAQHSSAADVVRNASASTIFCRGALATRIGEFDETIGFGTPLAGGEDLDFALRAYLLARMTRYQNAPLVGHRDKNPVLRSRYYASGLTVLARHAGWIFWREYVRKLVVGLVLTARCELSIARFAELALGSFREMRGFKPTSRRDCVMSLRVDS